MSVCANIPDVLAFVRRAIWGRKYLVNSKPGGERVELSGDDFEALLDRLAATA